MRELLDATFDELFPILRSITGPGYERSLEMIGRHIPFDYIDTPSGTKVFDWTVPQRWSCRAATLTDPDGSIIADMKDSCLHVMNYSVAVDADMTLDDLQPHLYSIPDLPDAIPYVTSYYAPKWGFCLRDSVRKSLRPGTYHAFIDSSFDDGGVRIAEALLPGELPQEIMISSYLCHPSLANNELSGPLTLMMLYKKIAAWPRRRCSYRFVLNPETIGSLCFLHHHFAESNSDRPNIVGGIVLTCTGGPSDRLSYKMSRGGRSLVDKLAQFRHERPYNVPRSSIEGLDIRRFDPTSGSDERQYCSPGFNMPIGQIARTVYGTYPGYHNSLDTKEFMNIDALVDSIEHIERFLRELDSAGVYENLSPYGEPQLGKRGLYPTTNSAATRTLSSDGLYDGRSQLNAIIWMLNGSDGTKDMIDIAQESGLELPLLLHAAEVLEEAGLLKYRGHR